MDKIKIYCVTNKTSEKLEELNYELAGVGRLNFPEKYINCKIGENIQDKEENYSELTFHYWFWKNKLPSLDESTWIGFCQKRRFWLKKDKNIENFSDLKENILIKTPKEWENFESILCSPIKVSNPKKMKLLKRGWKNLLNDPLVFFDQKKQTIKLQFDMHHGHGVLNKAIDVMNLEDRKSFRTYVNTQDSFNPHIMFISKKKIIAKWFEDLFDWLFKCETLFGFDELKGYDQKRLYAYLAERYLSFWFTKYSKSKSWPWCFFDTTTN